MDHREEKLDRILSAYRSSVGVPDSSVDFMPGMWAKIEARRNQGLVLTGFWRWAAVSLTACSLILGVWMGYSSSTESADSASYVDVLQEDHEEQLIASGGR
jgi:hypothetical protein